MRQSTMDGKNGTYGSNEGQHGAGDVPLGESSCGVCKHVFPFALEGSVLCGVAQCGVILDDEVLSEVLLEAPSPFSQGSWIVCEVIEG